MCICTCTLVTLSNICLTTVNTTNVFYYKILEYAVGAGTGSIWLRIGQVVDTCEYSNVPSGSIKCEEFLN
jgi:hypothetical protein